VILDQRRLAEEAMEERSAEWPSTAGRIRDARLHAGVADLEIAARLDMTPESYWDLESYDDEAYRCLSLRELATLCQILHVEPWVLLFGEKAREIQKQTTFREIHERLVERIRQRGMTSQQYGDEVGWDIDAVVDNPEEIWNFNLQELYDVCKALDLDWVAALPVLTTSPQG
jgi:transcriptional regulator with XRE-family HTH domain